MFDKFTERARKVMSLSRQEAQRLNSEFIGSEHILLAIMVEGGGVAAKVLKLSGIDSKRVIQETEKLVIPSTSPIITLGQLPFSPRAKRCLELAGEEASRAKSDVIGTEHLLFGLFLEKEGIAAQVLGKLGLVEKEIRLRMRDFLGPAAERISPPSTEPKRVSVRLWVFKSIENATANMTLVVDGVRYELSQIIPIQDVAPDQVSFIAQGLGSKVYVIEIMK